MTSDFERLKKIVLGAADRSGLERNDYLDRACADDPELREEVESLLGMQSVTVSLAATGGLPRLLETLPPAEREPPSRIGPYEILSVLGEGGMGVVYRARQTEPIRRDVALKLVRSGRASPEAEARFQAERQTLALMNHPHIAKVLDAGSDEDGNPYFVMELVEGTPLNEYCEREKPPLDTRLDLVQLVCRAIQHAHQRGIIHRDLKPSNLLITEQDGVPVPKVIDFGIAKAVGGDDHPLATQEGQLVGTVKYMSPEQVRGSNLELDTRTDVYSLGVVIYELLVGAPPYEPKDRSSLLEQLHVICHRSPAPFPRFDSGGRRLDRDLETIVLKSLEKEPERRYESVGALADDLERFRTSQPILARGPSAAYQLKKLVQRNRIPSALVAVILATLVGFGIWMSVLYAASERNLRRATRAESESAEVSDFLVGMFEIAHPSEAKGNEVTAREILDQGAARIDVELGGQPGVQSRLMRTMGVVYRGLGLYPEAEQLFEDSLRRMPSEAPGTERARVMNDLGRLHELEGELTEAERVLADAVAELRGSLPEGDPLIALYEANLGWVRARLGDLDQGERLIADAIEVLETGEGEELDLPLALGNLAQIHRAQGRYDEALAASTRALELFRARLPRGHPDLAMGLGNHSSILWELGRVDEALPLAEEALEIRKRSLGPDHPELAIELMNIAELYKDQGKLDIAEAALLRAREILIDRYGPNHADVAIAQNNLGTLYRSQGRLEEAFEMLEASLRVNRELHGSEHVHVSTALNNLGEVRAELGRYEEAERDYRRSIEIREALFGADDPRTSLPVHNLGLLMLETGRMAEAEVLLPRALRIREETLGPAHPRIVQSLEACAELRRREGRPEEAALLKQRAEEVRANLR